jgi:hypothetical protein
LPLTLLQHAADVFLPFSTAFNLRLPSVALALATFGMVAYILNRWYGQRTAIFGCIALGASAWFMHVGRSATFDITYFVALPTLLSAHLSLYYADQRVRALPFWLFCMAMLLYLPGLVWLVLLNTFWQRKELLDAWQGLKSWWQRPLVVLVMILLIAPLAHGFFVSQQAHFALTWLGVPSHVLHWYSPLQEAGYSLLFIGARSPADPSLWLGHQPVFDVFLATMLVIGVYFYATHTKADRTKLLLSITLLSIILTAGGIVTRSLIVPLLYLLAGGGIAYTLYLWLRVFPRNPLARGFGITLLAFTLGLSCLYNLRQYFIAWPHNPETKKVFVQKP